MKELHIEPMLNYIQHYQMQWKKHLLQIRVQLRFLKPPFTIDQMEKSFLGCPVKRWCENASVRLGLMSYSLFGRRRRRIYIYI
jgi:hypothetical protein